MLYGAGRAGAPNLAGKQGQGRVSSSKYYIEGEGKLRRTSYQSHQDSGTGFLLPAEQCALDRGCPRCCGLAGAVTICRGQEGPWFVAPRGTHFPRAGSRRLRPPTLLPLPRAGKQLAPAAGLPPGSARCPCGSSTAASQGSPRFPTTPGRLQGNKEVTQSWDYSYKAQGHNYK